MTKETNYAQVIEGLLFLSGSNGITIGELIAILSLDQMSIENHIMDLQEKYYQNDNAFTVINTAQTYKLTTTNANTSFYQSYAELEFNDSLSNSALETLTIIAYNQPITRFDIEEKRGVMASHNLRILITRDLIKVVGKSSELGRPNLYGTTPEFLDFLGLNSIEELPPLEEFTYVDDESDEQTDLFNEVDDFKEIKKRLLSSTNLIKVDHNIEFDSIEDIKVNKLDLSYGNEEIDDETTESNS